MADDWFNDALTLATATPEAHRARERAERMAANKAAIEAAFERTASRAKTDPAAAKAAAKLFEDVAAGKVSVSSAFPAAGARGTYTPPLRAGEGTVPRSPTPQQGLDAIIKAVREADDPFSAAGYWLTRVTQGITQARREAEEKE